MSKNLIPPGLTYIADNITSKGNILGASKGTGAKWANGLGLPKEAETVFFAGCGYQYSNDLESMMSLIRRMDKSNISEVGMGIASFQKKLGIDAAGIYRKVAGRGNSEDDAAVLRDAVRVLKKLGINFGYLAEEEPCCGGLLYYAGMRKEFTQNAKKVHDNLKSKGIKKIVSIVPSCTYTLQHLIPTSTGIDDIEVKHFCEVVADRVSSLNLQFPKQAKVTYHDPCQLVRYLGLTEEPRKILTSIKGLDFVETDWTKGKWATCCGGGGGFEAVFPELSQILAVKRAKELIDTGAKIIATHCPGCIMQLKTGLKELHADDVEVLDLAQIVAMSIEDK